MVKCGRFYDGETMSKQAKLLAAFEAGNTFTAKQISASFGLKDPVASIRNLRDQGHCIYGNSSKLYDGTETIKYRLGKPTRSMVALASHLIGAQAFAR